MKILVTGSAGLIGVQVVTQFAKRERQAPGIDNRWMYQVA